MKIKFQKNTILIYLLYLFLIFPFFKPMYLTTFPFINKIYNLLQVVNFILIIIFTLKDKKVSKVNMLIILFNMILMLSTILNNGNLEEVITSSMRLISLCLLIELAIRRNPKEFLRVFEFLLSVLIIINMLSIFLYPDGMYISSVTGYSSNWFLGFKNTHILYILPTLIISIINSYIDGEKISKRTIILFLVALISSIKVWSATSLVAIFLLIFFLILIKVLKKHNFKMLFLTYIVAFFSIIIFRLQNIFKYIIVDILGKDLTFTGRTFIWDYVIEYIKAKPILGYGYEYGAIRFAKGYNYHSYHAHNIILEILYQTGICGLIIIILIMKLIIKKLEEYKQNAIAKILAFALFIYMIMMLMEAFSFEYFFYIFTLCYSVSYIIECEKKCKGVSDHERTM